MRSFFKKLTAVFVSAVTACSIAFPAFPVSAAELRNGDTNLDYKVNLYDAINICKHMMKIELLTGVNFRQADYNKDGKVNLSDAVFISRLMMHEKKLKEVAALLNYKRSAEGADDLIYEPAISDAAMKRAGELAVMWSKDVRPNNKGNFDSIFKEYEIAFEKCANFVGAGPSKPAELVNALMGSEKLREKLLDDEYTRIGVGYYYTSDESDEHKHYWAVFLMK